MRGITWILVAAAAILVGCAVGGAPRSPSEPMEITEANVVGTWQDDHGATLVFEQGGNFRGSNLPHQELEGFSAMPSPFDPATDRLPASGWWSLSPSIGAPSGPPMEVVLHVRQVAGRRAAVALRMRAERQNSDAVLTFYIGDPDLKDRIVYKRCDQTCPTAVPTF
jgi:hypothetical protein